MERLMRLTKILRTPETGCPWDLKQDFDTYCKCILEESQEVVDAVQKKDWANLKEELGDVLFNVCFFINLAEEQGLFTVEEVIASSEAKMIHRHPHVFGEEKAKNAEEALAIFNRMKAKEKS